ncbi:MAG: membrane protein insertion efficiency factor YidD [Hyphomicrobiaceae bacterium]|nr:membrane protein insertion efficiency factor YidD [Hyphomicrobiaceae bacterium]
MSFLAQMAKRGVKSALLLPILIYRYMISPFLPGVCRHIPSCSQYAADAIELNGGWKGGWLGLSRLLRCHPWGSQGLDPAPDLRDEHHPFYLSWRYGRWSGTHILERFDEAEKTFRKCPNCKP